MAWIDDEKTPGENIPTPGVPKKKAEFDEAKIHELIFKKKAGDSSSKVCCLLYGKDGTGKSGIVQDFPLAEGEKMVMIDFDSGNEPLLYKYHKDKEIYIHDPVVTVVLEDKTVIDYDTTMNNVRNIIEYLRRNYQKDNVKAIVIDGLSSMLKKAEYMMRVEKNLMPDQGVSLRYWINRNKVFEEILELTKSIPIARFFISHEDFIAEENKEMSAIKSKTNQLMFQKLRCLREDTADEVIYKVVVDKSKYDSAIEGHEMVFLKVNKKDKKVEWKGQEVLQLIM